MSFLLFFLTNPIGRLIGVGAIMLVLGFAQGYAVKARLDRSATLQAVIAKQRIDLDAANDTAAQAQTTAAALSAADAANQETIRDLQKPKGPTPAAVCNADDAAARGLRRLR